MTPVLEVRDLRVRLPTDDGVVTAVDGVSYRVEAGRTLGIVGESGSGKSISSLTLMGLTRFHPAPRSAARSCSTGAICCGRPTRSCGRSAAGRSR